jgi:hypothetical protein
MFRVIRMPQVRARIRFIWRSLEVRFYAGRGKPPGGSALFRVAQLDAAAARQGFMAAAVACRSGNGLQARGHIAIDGDHRQESQHEYSGQANIERPLGNHGHKQRLHASFCGRSEEKPIAQRVSKNHY